MSTRLPKHLLLEQSMFFSLRKRRSFIPLLDNMQNCSSVYFSLYVSRLKKEDKGLWTEMHQAFPQFNLLLIPSCITF